MIHEDGAQNDRANNNRPRAHSDAALEKMMAPGDRPGGSLEAIHSGVYLENRRTLLPWGARFEHLAKFAQPDRILQAVDWYEMYWQRPVLFNLQAHWLQVTLFPFGWMDLAAALLASSEYRRCAFDCYQSALAHLSAHIGAPREINTGTCPCVEQLAAWEWEQVCLNLILKRSEKPLESSYSCVLHFNRRSCRAISGNDSAHFCG